MWSRFQTLIRELEQDRSLQEPPSLRRRIEAQDRIEAYLLGAQDEDGGDREPELRAQAEALGARLEAINRQTYARLRDEITRGMRPADLLRWLMETASKGDPSTSTTGDGYDYLDVLLSGVLQFEAPREPEEVLPPEMVFYQPTPARHILELIRLTQLSDRDVLIDLGAGLGHVPLLASMCTGARAVGIELEPAYVECAQRCARALKLSRVELVAQDAREADLTQGTVFYLYTPFIGSVLRTVLDSLRREAAARALRVCTYGPCTPIVAREAWLESAGAPQLDRVTVFRSTGAPKAPEGYDGQSESRRTP